MCHMLRVTCRVSSVLFFFSSSHSVYHGSHDMRHVLGVKCNFFSFFLWTNLVKLVSAPCETAGLRAEPILSQKGDPRTAGPVD